MERTRAITEKAFADVENRIRNNPNIDEKEKEKLIEEVQKDKDEAIKNLGPLGWDGWIFRIAILVLGTAVIGAIVGTIWLTLRGVAELPTILLALGSASVGAIAGLLTPNPGNR